MTADELSIGKKVTYIPKFWFWSYNNRELGIVTSWNDKYVFVDYVGNGRGVATRLEDLVAGDQTFYCADEHNSVMDGAFGRCPNQCSNCRLERTRKY